MIKPVKPSEPIECHYGEKVIRRYIYRCVESLYDDEGEEEEVQKDNLKKPISEVNLAWLVEQATKVGVKPEDVKIDFGFYANSIAYETHHVCFYYEVKVPAKNREYKAAMNKYKKDLFKYEHDLAVYNEWEKSKQIKKLEQKLAKLKGAKPLICYPGKAI